ncbi:hypothetical protein IWW36_003911, partial [Coemansia brasiliensis]
PQANDPLAQFQSIAPATNPDDPGPTVGVTVDSGPITNFIQAASNGWGPEPPFTS